MPTLARSATSTPPTAIGAASAVATRSATSSASRGSATSSSRNANSSPPRRVDSRPRRPDLSAGGPGSQRPFRRRVGELRPGRRPGGHLRAALQRRGHSPLERNSDQHVYDWTPDPPERRDRVVGGIRRRVAERGPGRRRVGSFRAAVGRRRRCGDRRARARDLHHGGSEVPAGGGHRGRRLPRRLGRRGGRRLEPGLRPASSPRTRRPGRMPTGSTTFRLRTTRPIPTSPPTRAEASPSSGRVSNRTATTSASTRGGEAFPRPGRSRSTSGQRARARPTSTGCSSRRRR